MWQINRLTLWELSREIASARRPDKKVWIEALRSHKDPSIARIAYFLIDMSIRSRTERLEDIIDILTGSRSLDLSEDYSDTSDRNQFTLRIDGVDTSYVSPLYEYYFSTLELEKDPTLYARHRANVRKLIDSIRSYRKQQGRLMLSDFAEYIRLIDTYDISVTSSHLIGEDDAVACITAHKAK
jgi:hypothetical protein